MTKFKYGDNVIHENSSAICRIYDIDTTTSALPRYLIGKSRSTAKWNYGVGWRRVYKDDEVLRYGEVLTNDMLYCEVQAEDGFEDYKHIRIRTISYDNRIFYHKMENGEVVEFKELMV